MNMSHWNEIQRRIQSLSMSTDFTVLYRDFGLVARGLNSMYVSHQSLDLIEGHGVDDVMVFVNKNVYIVVAPFAYIYGALDDGFVVEKIPSVFLRGLYRLQGQIPIKHKEVVLFFEDLFTGYDADGKPVYREGKKLQEILALIKQDNDKVSY